VILTNTTTASDCQTPSGQIPVDKPEQGTDGYGEKDFKEKKVRELQMIKISKMNL